MTTARNFPSGDFARESGWPPRSQVAETVFVAMSTTAR
jgi:hypothetical protein